MVIFKLKQNGISGKTFSSYLFYGIGNKGLCLMVKIRQGPMFMLKFHKDLLLGSLLLLLLIYVNDFSDNLTSNLKDFADVVSLFLVVHDVNNSAKD